MNAPHLHLLLNHFPIACLLFGFVIFLVGWIRKQEPVARTGLGILVVGGICGLVAYLTGNAAASALGSGLEPVKALVRQHAQAGIFGLVSTLVAAAAAAGALVLARRRGTAPFGYVIFLILVNLWAVAVVARVSYLGALISHPEIRTGAK